MLKSKYMFGQTIHVFMFLFCDTLSTVQVLYRGRGTFMSQVLRSTLIMPQIK